jgi:hypothetical protein
METASLLYVHNYCLQCYNDAEKSSTHKEKGARVLIKESSTKLAEICRESGKAQLKSQTPLIRTLIVVPSLMLLC